MDLMYGTSDFSRNRGDFPALPVVNMYAEEVPLEHSLVLQSRLGLDNTGIVMGAGPVTELFQIDGVLSNNLFGISGGTLYKGGVSIGAIAGTGVPRMDGYATQLFITKGTTLYKYDGAALTTVATPGGFNVRSLCVGGDRLVVIDDTTGIIYWTDVLDVTLPALNFATAENSPDNLKELLFLGDTLYLFGSETVEIWPISGDANAPYAPLVGRTFQVGIRDTGCATKFDGTYVWVTNENRVCIQTPENIISTLGLEDKIASSSSVSLWNFWMEGIEFIAVSLDTETHVFNNRAKTWSQFESYGEDNFLPICYVNGVFGSRLDGNLLEFGANYSDFGDVLERRFRAGLSLTNESPRVDNLVIRCNPGHTSYLAGAYADPTVEMRTSRDGGYEWTTWRPRTLGALGKYRAVVNYRALGMFSFPGFLAEFRVTDPVPFRVSGIKINEVGGRV
jgi:hypothetical protein